MRGWIMIAVLGLSACGEHLGLNPNYMWEGGDYAAYRAERELALVNNSTEPATVPISRPFTSPVIAEPVPAPATMGLTTGADGRAMAKSSARAAVASPAASASTAVSAPMVITPPELQGTDGYGKGTGMVSAAP